MCARTTGFSSRSIEGGVDMGNNRRGPDKIEALLMYSSELNPDLEEFMRKYRKPCDLGKDDYERGPFAEEIVVSKADPIYNMHTYWSKKHYKAIMKFIEHYTEPEDLVLDQFCGSGMTGVAALALGRIPILIDLSPAASFITKYHVTPVDPKRLRKAFQQLLETRVGERTNTARFNEGDYRGQSSFNLVGGTGSQVPTLRHELEWLYETRCDRCGARATTGYVVWSQTFQCEKCLRIVPLYDCVSTEIVGDKGKKIERRKTPYLYPRDRMMNSPENQECWGYLWRKGYHHKIERVDQFFTKRNLWALAAFKNEIERFPDLTVRDALRFVFQANLLQGTIMQQYREAGGGHQRGTYYVPPIFVERNQKTTFKRKLGQISNGFEALSLVLMIESTTLQPKIISTQSATSISQIPKDSIDYIFTDPSYAWKVQFGELNFLWESWLGFDTSWLRDEIIINPVRGIYEENWARMMKKVFTEAYRVLKPGRWMSVCYHDTSEGTWQTIQDILIEVGFELSDVGVLSPQQKSYNQLMADKVIKVDLVLNCRKPKPGETKVLGQKGPSIEDKVSEIVTDYLNRRPGSTKDEIWNVVVARLVSEGAMKRHDFEAILRKLANENEARMWFLKEEYEEIKPSEREKEEKAAKAIEGFMKERTEKAGIREVEFYDILFFYLTDYLRGKTRQLAPMRRLPEILEDYFIRAIKGYRLPQTDDERALLKESRDKGISRQIRKYLRYLVRGILLPEEKKPDAETIMDWIKNCRRVGMYQEGAILYEKGGLIISKLPEKKIVDIEEDYKICKRRSKRRR
jgi:hypothetical protein